MNNEIKGCVYFFRHLTKKPVKIGYTGNATPRKRFEQFKTYAPFGAELLGFIRCEEPEFLEKELHNKYSEKRMKGEWFNITEDDIKKDIEKYTNYGEKIRRSNYEINYMDYLEGIFKGKSININSDLNDFLDNYNFKEIDISRKELRLMFLEKYPERKKSFTAQKFNRDVKIYAEYHNINLLEKKKDGIINFVVHKNKKLK